MVLYFTKLASEQICAPFIISENNKIENYSNSTIKVYDYYKPEFEASEVNYRKVVETETLNNMCQQVYKIRGCAESDAPIPQLEINTNISPEIKPSNFTSVTIRSVNMTGLNPDFVNMDVEMVTPGGTTYHD